MIFLCSFTNFAHKFLLPTSWTLEVLYGQNILIAVSFGHRSGRTEKFFLIPHPMHTYTELRTQTHMELLSLPELYCKFVCCFKCLQIVFTTSYGHSPPSATAVLEPICNPCMLLCTDIYKRDTHVEN